MTQDSLLINTRKRDKKEKRAKDIRKKGEIPGVIYGPKIEPISLIFTTDQARLIEKKSHEASVLHCQIDSEKNTRNIIIQDLQYDKVKNQLLHIDLYEVDMTQKIETEVPLEFTGNAPAVKNLSGTLVKYIDQISIKCLPKDLPEKIVVDLQSLATFDDYIHVKDLNVAENVEVMHNDDDVVAVVSPPRTEKEMEELEGKVEDEVDKVEGVKDKAEEDDEGKEVNEKENKTEKEEKN